MWVQEYLPGSSTRAGPSLVHCRDRDVGSGICVGGYKFLKRQVRWFGIPILEKMGGWPGRGEAWELWTCVHGHGTCVCGRGMCKCGAEYKAVVW